MTCCSGGNGGHGRTKGGEEKLPGVIREEKEDGREEMEKESKGEKDKTGVERRENELKVKEGMQSEDKGGV